MYCMVVLLVNFLYITSTSSDVLLMMNLLYYSNCTLLVIVAESMLHHQATMLLNTVGMPARGSPAGLYFATVLVVILLNHFVKFFSVNMGGANLQ